MRRLGVTNPYFVCIETPDYDLPYGRSGGREQLARGDKNSPLADRVMFLQPLF